MSLLAKIKQAEAAQVTGTDTESGRSWQPNVINAIHDQPAAPSIVPPLPSPWGDASPGLIARARRFGVTMTIVDNRIELVFPPSLDETERVGMREGFDIFTSQILARLTIEAAAQPATVALIKPSKSAPPFDPTPKGAA